MYRKKTRQRSAQSASFLGGCGEGGAQQDVRTAGCYFSRMCEKAQVPRKVLTTLIPVISHLGRPLRLRAAVKYTVR